MSAEEERFLVYAPTGRDAILACEAIQRAGMLAQCCVGESALLRDLEEACGGIVLTEEGATRAVVSALTAVIERQPTWSDIPILLLTSSTRSALAPSAYLMRMAGERGNVMLVERPLRVDTLVSTVKTALRSRRRQYEIRDYMSDRERSEEKMRETAKLESIGVLAGGIAHDFNNLLTGVIGNTSLCLEMTSGPEIRERLLEVMSAAERAAELTSQLLAYAGKGRFVIGPIDLSTLAAEIVPMVRRFIPSMAELQMKPGANIPFVSGDHAQLQQVVMNLIINAAEAIPEGEPGTITIATGVRELRAGDWDSGFAAFEAVPGSYVYLDIADTGCGMTEEVRARIFDPFFTTKFQGRGLGLAAVLGIVRGHKGAMRVASQVGKGTTFSVYFPVSGAVSDAPKLRRRLVAVPPGTTVLFVDDDANVRSLAATALGKHGIEIHVAASGQEAVDIFQRFSRGISAVILDMGLPGMSSQEALAALREVRTDVSVILSSGYSEAIMRERFGGQTLNGFLQKPYTSKQLIEEICAAAAKGHVDGT